MPATDHRRQPGTGSRKMLKLRSIGIRDYSVLEGEQRTGRIIGAVAMFVVLRASQIYSQSGKPGRLPTGKTHFYEEIEPKLEKVALGPKAVGYTERSLDKLIEQSIEPRAERAAAKAARDPRQRAPSI